MRLSTLAAAQFGLPETEAAALIMAGRVYIGTLPADKPGEDVPPDTPLILKEKARRYASRSGYKLEKALTRFELDVTDALACDIGASNGGFTDCLLQHGASHVAAVDVAYGILAWELRQNARVQVLERVNARTLTPDMLICEANPTGHCAIVTADVSFISLRRIFPVINAILTENGDCVCLVKPQFEASRRQVGKNGQLRDPSALPQLLQSLMESAKADCLQVCGMTVSPIHGTHGNVEYLAHFRRETAKAEATAAIIAAAVAEAPDA